MNKEQYFNELYKRYGAVTRARNCFFYTKKGIRITDLFQENGRAILGWEGGNAFTHLKNTLCRGLTGSFITEDFSRVEKAVSTLFDSPRKIFYFSDKESAVKAGLLLSENKTFIYKPWAPQKLNCKDLDCIVLAPPLPWCETIFILAVNPDIYVSSPEKELLIPKSIKQPYALEAAIARAIYNLIDALKVRQEKDWFIYDPVLTKYWERKGPYLFPKIPKDKYDSFILHCLDLGIAINPCYNNPSIIPFGADKGVFTKLKNTPFLY